MMNDLVSAAILRFFKSPNQCALRTIAFMHIHQLSASYIAEQDRILLRINTHEHAELRLWLTQRLMRGLYPQLLRYDARAALASAQAQSPEKTQAHSPEAQQMLAEIKREAVLHSSDFSTPFVEPQAPQDSPAALLVTRVNLRMSDGVQAQGSAGVQTLATSDVQLHFEEILPEDGGQARGFQFNFTATVFHGLVELLRQTLQKSEWTGVLPPEPDAANWGEGEPPLHLL